MEAHVQNVRVGTSGWSYDDWRGTVYPVGEEVDRLAYLAGFLDTLEVNSSFYHPPTPGMTAGWLRRTPERLDFTVKLHQRFTHERSAPYTRTELDVFRRGIAPLHEAGRLGAVLMQFPWSLRFDEPARLWLDQLGRDFRKYPIVVEVRHRGWQSTDAAKFLSVHGLNVAVIDQPRMPENLPPTLVATGPIGYVRLHGRNAEQWFASMRAPQDTPQARQAARGARYDYLYRPEELQEWVPRILALAGQTGRTYVFANNHPRGQAVANALQLKHLLTGGKVRVPPATLEAFPFLSDIAETAGRQGSLF